ncbi:MAG: glycosyltransferase, partial [Firmicutes bacterium]|nr:glycosyltransferase [Bacillota bacterium]
TDIITTVSPSYAEEITTAYYGERLDGLIRARRADLYGVLNGIDTDLYNPETDTNIAHTFTKDTLDFKQINKQALQKELALEERADTPLIAMVGRLSNQKGLDLVDCVLSDIMAESLQIAVLGMGDSRYTNLFSWAETKYKGKLAARFAMDSVLAHKMYAGADFFLMPSLFEPCGLSQMIAMRYGSVPIVRETGGLRDTVLSYNDESNEGNGFSFQNYNAHDMLSVIRRALDFYKNKKEILHTLRVRGMEGDFTWTHSARDYVALYRKLIKR